MTDPVAPPGGPRRARLPNRRMSITTAIRWHGREWLADIGFDPAGRAREVFLDGEKTGSEFEGLLDDACILLSLLLQHGVSARAIAMSLGREGAGGPPASPIGLVAEKIAETEDSGGQGIREAYAASRALRRVSEP